MSNIPDKLFSFDLRSEILKLEKDGTVEKGTVDEMDRLSEKLKDSIKNLKASFSENKQR